MTHNANLLVITQWLDDMVIQNVSNTRWPDGVSNAWCTISCVQTSVSGFCEKLSSLCYLSVVIYQSIVYW